MSENLLIDEDLARVLDILEQVKKLNNMIGLHKSDAHDSLMAEQYEDMKMRYLEELKQILASYQIEVKINEKAA